MTQTFGSLVGEARAARGVSLRVVADALGVSVPFVHDVEHGRRRLTPARWQALTVALPTLSLRALAEAAIAEGPVEIDARTLTPEQRAQVVEALLRAAGA